MRLLLLMAYIYQSTNPCLCTSSTPSTPTTPECPDDCNCLKVCNISINPSDSRAVGPCAKTGTLDLMLDEFGHDFCACGSNTPRWTVEYKDPAVFVTATVTSAGVLTWITAGLSALEAIAGQIILKVCCGSLTYYVTVLIGIADLCNCPDCNDCETCDPCTGDCVEAEIDIFLNTVPQSGNTLLD